jgi:predicted N-acyltransferase
MQNISDVDQTAWDALAVPLKTPFLEWEWLRQMEVSGSMTAKTGWLPQHLTVWSGRHLVAAAPLYIKGHSAGEFVFDYAWADLANRLGIRYYPKMVGMSPATPMVGYRFLIAPGEDETRLTELMIEEIERFSLRLGIAGCSFLFVDPDWGFQLKQQGYSSWLHQSYDWQNPGYETFEDYLARFKSNQRRNIRRERKALIDQGITIKAYTGEEIPRFFFPLMYRFYVRTNEQYGPWAAKYLTKSFFEGLYQGYRHRILIMAAYQKRNQREPMAMSLLLTKGDQLYGRYWGSFKKVNALHYNACYYSPIEWAINNGIRHFDPGAGSTHKLRRGFLAVSNFSLHRFFDRRLRQIMRSHIDEINRLEQQQIDDLNQRLPFSNLERKKPFRVPDAS